MTASPPNDRPADGTDRTTEASRGADANGQADDSRDGRATATWSRDESGEPATAEGRPHVLLLLGAGRNRQLLADFLATEASVTATTDVETLSESVDLCLVDGRQLAAHRDAITARREAVAPVFFPVVLVDSQRSPPTEDVWTVVDEVVQTPIAKPILRARLRNLLARRRGSCRLAVRETELETALTELRVRDRAIAEAPIGVTIAGPPADDAPLVYVNDAFCELTGYDRAEIVGRNCRFLQGERTDEETVRTVRTALDAAEPVSVDLVNYTRDGEQFWNKLDIAPVHDDDGAVTHFVGFQTDITARKLHEQRVEVLNRFMRHNLRNELNIIDGYRDALTTDVGVDRETALDRIGESIGRLVGLSEEASHIEQVFDRHPDRLDTRPVGAVIGEVRERVERRYADVTVHVEMPDEPVYVSARTLPLGCVDYLSMLLDADTDADTNTETDTEPTTTDTGTETDTEPTTTDTGTTDASESDGRHVSVVARVDDGVVDIALRADCGGLSESDWCVVEAGVETPLHHTDHLGLWVVRWVTTMNGGALVRAEDGTLHARFPVRSPPSPPPLDRDRQSKS